MGVARSAEGGLDGLNEKAVGLLRLSLLEFVRDLGRRAQLGTTVSQRIPGDALASKKTQASEMFRVGSALLQMGSWADISEAAIELLEAAAAGWEEVGDEANA